MFLYASQDSGFKAVKNKLIFRQIGTEKRADTKRFRWWSKLTRVTNGTRISGTDAVAEEFIRILSAYARVFARIWITTIQHLAGVEDYLTVATILVLLPIGRHLVITIDAYHSHATDESTIRPHSGYSSAYEINGPCQDIQKPLRSHRPTVHVQDQTVLRYRQDNLMPLSVVECFVEVVQNCSRIFFGLNLDFELAILKEELQKFLL